MNENEHSQSLSGAASQEAAAPAEPSLQDSDDPLEWLPDALSISAHEGLSEQRALRSRRHFELGELIAHFSAHRFTSTPHRMTVQVGEATHLELQPRCLELMNHGCDPNVWVDVARFELVALRPIAPGDELTFFYPATEWRMAAPFTCVCGALRCLGQVDGAERLGWARLAGHRLSPHIEALLAQRAREEATPEPGLLALVLA